MNNKRFKPFVGARYSEGICNNICTFVLAASRYCTESNCKLWDICTKSHVPEAIAIEECPVLNKEKKDVVVFEDNEYKTANQVCMDPPTDIDSYYTLEQSNVREILEFCMYEDCLNVYQAHRNFTKWMLKTLNMNTALTIDNRKEIYSRLAFNEYIHKMLPNSQTPTCNEEFHFKNFCDELESLPQKPRLVVVWGTKVRNALVQHLKLDKSDDKGYFHVTTIPNQDFWICFINHPCISNDENESKRLLAALEEAKKIKSK